MSILIRTVDRPAWLAQALSSVAEQTWPNVEAVVIEDGPERSREVIERFRGRLPIVYRATGEKVGRARAGNLAMASATGEWMNFLDDDDLLFADHVETLVEAVTAAGAAGGYALSWETATEMIDRDRAQYREIAHVTRHRQPFDRLTLWHHNYLPIQAVLFHRRLYERHGGFAEDMDQLEDWNLWTRYTLDESFVEVAKTTSIYRVPAGTREAAGRQELLDQAYRDAVERQRSMQLTLSPLRDLADGRRLRALAGAADGRAARSAALHRRAALAVAAGVVPAARHAPAAATAIDPARLTGRVAAARAPRDRCRGGASAQAATSARRAQRNVTTTGW